MSLVTLGVADLSRAVAFYEGVLGWKAAPGPDGVAFFQLPGLILSLFPHAELAKDMGIAAGRTGAYEGFALAYNARSREEVDAIFTELERKGATITKRPETAFWGGYSGYFADPDGHQWEVAHNPYWSIDAEGRVSLGRG
jgi:catechol 2,3-dioxygenase-like lactoylglutathione lyase family enzyme